MVQTLLNSLRDWNKTTSERAKLQHAYITTALVILIVAGIIGLINYNLGQAMLFSAIVFAGVFIMNAVVWALLQSFVFDRLARRPAARPPKK